MPVRIGKVELPGVQNLFTEEARTLVEQRVPDQQGSVFQDLGREPVTIVVEGLLIGEKVLESLEELRAAQAKSEALPFAADIAVGTELTDVVIEDIRVRQLAGYKHRYRFTIRIREHIEAPEPAGAGLADVNAGVQNDADNWAADSLAAASVLQDPGSLGDALAAQPNMLENLSMEDLGSSIAKNAAGLTGGDFSGIIKAVGSIDINTAMELIQAVRDAESLGDFLSKYADEGLDLLEDLSGLDLSQASALVKAFAGGLEFLKKLKEVSDAAGTLADDIKTFDPLSGLRPLLQQQ